MIYTVEEALKPGHTDAVWDIWTSEMKPASKVLAVPGFNTAQRFKGLGLDPAPSLALYSIDSADVMTSKRYFDNGGGKLGSPKWGEHLSFWHRNLFEGLDEAPEVADDARLLVIDTASPDVHLEGLTITWLKGVGLDRTTPYRGLVIVDQATADNYLRAPHPQVRVFVARMRRLLASHS